MFLDEAEQPVNSRLNHSDRKREQDRRQLKAKKLKAVRKKAKCAQNCRGPRPSSPSRVRGKFAFACDVCISSKLAEHEKKWKELGLGPTTGVPDFMKAQDMLESKLREGKLKSEPSSMQRIERQGPHEASMALGRVLIEKFAHQLAMLKFMDVEDDDDGSESHTSSLETTSDDEDGPPSGCVFSSNDNFPREFRNLVGPREQGHSSANPFLGTLNSSSTRVRRSPRSRNSRNAANSKSPSRSVSRSPTPENLSSPSPRKRLGRDLLSSTRASNYHTQRYAQSSRMTNSPDATGIVSSLTPFADASPATPSPSSRARNCRDLVASSPLRNVRNARFDGVLEEHSDEAYLPSKPKPSRL